MFYHMYSITFAVWDAVGSRGAHCTEQAAPFRVYGQFSKFQIVFCGLDPGNLKFETVRTNKQRICF